MSSLGPNDSISSAPQKKSKPGKSERAAKRAASQVSGVPASTNKAAAFGSGGSSAPVPTPGRFPVVFQTGAGEPSRDHEFAYDPATLKDVASSFFWRYQKNPRYTEFRAHAGVSESDFYKQMTAVFLLGLAQQTVHAHVNMGLPQLDFAPIASSDIRAPSAQLSVLGQFGEFSEAYLGTRFVLADYTSTVRRLVQTAEHIMQGKHSDVGSILSRGWLPTSPTDGGTRLVIAGKLRKRLALADIDIAGTALEEAVFSGEVPEFWETVKNAFGDEPVEGSADSRDRFDFLFRRYPDVGQFTTAFTTEGAAAVLQELDLPWDTPSAGHLDWGFSAKSAFSDLVDKWARHSAAYAQFFELGSSLVTRSNAQGSPSQFVEVKTVDVVTVVKTHVALSAPQFSLAACFPPSAVFAGDVLRNVIVSTPLAIEQRATEFVQLDWR